MKTKSNALVLPGIAALGLAGQVSASVLQPDRVVMTTVPDANPSGLGSQIHVPNTGLLITDVNVTLTLSGNLPAGGWTGDLYAWVSHGGARSVLLNRVGRTASETLGYDDDSLLGVVFDDQSLNGDVHLYQATLGGAPGSLTGTWVPDGRDVDPAVAMDADPRTLDLSVFNGQDPIGDWILFVADVSGGATVSLIGWQLELTVTAVPEPLTTGALTGVLSLAWVWHRRRQQKRPQA